MTTLLRRDALSQNKMPVPLWSDSLSQLELLKYGRSTEGDTLLLRYLRNSTVEVELLVVLWRPWHVLGMKWEEEAVHLVCPYRPANNKLF